MESVGLCLWLARNPHQEMKREVGVREKGWEKLFLWLGDSVSVRVSASGTVVCGDKEGSVSTEGKEAMRRLVLSQAYSGSRSLLLSSSQAHPQPHWARGAPTRGLPCVPSTHTHTHAQAYSSHLTRWRGEWTTQRLTSQRQLASSSILSCSVNTNNRC